MRYNRVPRRLKAARVFLAVISYGIVSLLSQTPLSLVPQVVKAAPPGPNVTLARYVETVIPSYYRTWGETDAVEGKSSATILLFGAPISEPDGQLYGGVAGAEIYGTTSTGCANGARCTVYEIEPAVEAYIETVIASWRW